MIYKIKRITGAFEVFLNGQFVQSFATELSARAFIRQERFGERLVLCRVVQLDGTLGFRRVARSVK